MVLDLDEQEREIIENALDAWIDNEDDDVREDDEDGRARRQPRLDGARLLLARVQNGE